MPKLRILTHGAGYAWDGTIHAWFPGVVEEVPETKEARAWAAAFVAAGSAEYAGGAVEQKRSSSPAEEAASEAEPPATQKEPTQKVPTARPRVERKGR